MDEIAVTQYIQTQLSTVSMKTIFAVINTT